MRASYEPTDLCALTRDLASNFRSAMERASLEFTVTCDAIDEPLYVDREMWEKIVLNLLSNALKFTLEGGVSLRLTRDGDRALLRVADTGVGMPKHELPRLFERFYRVEGVEGRTHEGTGIGLALVQELVRLHGGTIEADSELGRGTEFRVRIPFGTAHLPAERVRDERRSLTSGGAAQAFVQEALRWLHDDTPRRKSCARRQRGATIASPGRSARASCSRRTTRTCAGTSPACSRRTIPSKRSQTARLRSRPHGARAPLSCSRT